MSNRELKPPTSSWRVLLWLWRTARLRARGRTKRQRELRKQKTGSDGNTMAAFIAILGIVMSAFVHGILGWTLISGARVSHLLELNTDQLIAVEANDYFFERLKVTEEKLAEAREANDPAKLRLAQGNWDSAVNRLARDLGYELEELYGGTRQEHFQKVVAHCKTYGSAGFITTDRIHSDLKEPGKIPNCFWAWTGLIILWWFMMLVFQGEGLEFDIQRRRHPLWEWIFSHPVRPSIAFAGEMLTPLMANPIYLSAPIFWFFALYSTFGLGAGFLLSLAIGIPLAVTASCLNKSIEISALLRLPVRRRGVLLGLMSWAGYVGMIIPFFTLQAPFLKAMVLQWLAPVETLSPWVLPFRAILTGWGDPADGIQAALTASGISIVGIGIALALAVWGTSRGLQSSGDSNVTVSKKLSIASDRSLIKNPYYRKEILWLWRDKGAVVQIFLLPLTMGALQAFNLRGLASLSTTNWNFLCGIAIICGTYFLLVLGPRSLTSEGGALWIPLTWPHGLESLLKAKARLWWTFSTLVVYSILTWAIFVYPDHWWRILLVAAGWYIFSRALAMKAVTLVTAPSSSGEPERPSQGRKWAAMIGTLAFGIGVMTRSWHTAMIGIVFSSLTAAAMWQNLRARLPYLFDPWSEKLPKAPSLMHAMIGTAILVEFVGIGSAVALAVGNTESLWIARAISYGLIGLIAWIAMDQFLAGRGVTSRQIWSWHREGHHFRSWQSLGASLATGASLAGLAYLYLEFLKWLPLTRDYMEKLAHISAEHAGGGLIWQGILTVGLAPLAEEYFFRGLLYRALDREWGGWKAVIGSAAFFAVYHPPVSWLPVFALGIATAWLFKRGGKLLPCVLMHMIYNLFVLFFN